jgi:AraC-like DNA-binding protein
MEETVNISLISSNRLIEYFDSKNIFDTKWHSHPEYQLIVYLKGKGIRHIGNNVKNYTDGDMVFLGPNIPHLWKNDEKINSHCLAIFFDKNLFNSQILDKEEFGSIKQLFQKSLQGLEIIGDTNRDIVKMMIELGQSHQISKVSILLNILNRLAANKECKLICTEGYNGNHNNGSDRINKIQSYINNNFKKKVTLEEVAALTNMSPTSFSRYFKLSTNKSFSNFLTEIRVGNACKLLIEKNVNITEACYESGFNTISNFNRQFKTLTGVSPLEYKRSFFNIK